MGLKIHIDWHKVLKVTSGIIIVPIALIAYKLWPWWVKASLPIKIMTGIIVLPITGIAYLGSWWWNDY